MTRVVVITLTARNAWSAFLLVRENLTLVKSEMLKKVGHAIEKRVETRGATVKEDSSVATTGKPKRETVAGGEEEAGRVATEGAEETDEALLLC